MNRRKFVLTGIGVAALSTAIAAFPNMGPYGANDSLRARLLAGEIQIDRVHYTIVVKELCTQEIHDHVYALGASTSEVSIGKRDLVLKFEPIMWNDEEPSIHLVILEEDADTGFRVLTETSMGLGSFSAYTNPDLNLHLEFFAVLDPV